MSSKQNRPGQRRGAGRGGASRGRSSSGSIIWVLPAVAVVLVGVVAFGLMRGHQGDGQAPSQDGKPVPPEVMAALTQVPPATWSAVGATGARPPQAVPPTDTAAAGTTPQVLYIGAEFCPYCAAQRWPLIVALSRFGQFQGLKLSTSSATDVDPSTPTFTFHGSTYTSPYLELETVESEGNVERGGRYPTLEKPTLIQEQLISKYDEPPYVSRADAGAIPFLLIGQTYMWSGASYDAQMLQGETWQSIAAKLATAQGPVGQAILVNANMITAAICKLNGGRPVDVCGNPGVQAAAAMLPAPGS